VREVPSDKNGSQFGSREANRKASGTRLDIEENEITGTKVIFYANFEKSGDFYFYREGQERVSKSGDFISRREYHRFEIPIKCCGKRNVLRLCM
jgi:hypothetical protein